LFISTLKNMGFAVLHAMRSYATSLNNVALKLN